MSWILAFLGFAALVILHEAGHFFAAKAVGMRVERFSLFFPPLIGRIKRALDTVDTRPVGHFSDLYKADGMAREAARSLIEGVAA